MASVEESGRKTTSQKSHLKIFDLFMRFLTHAEPVTRGIHEFAGKKKNIKFDTNTSKIDTSI